MTCAYCVCICMYVIHAHSAMSSTYTVHTCIHTYIHTYVNTYIHTYIHTYIPVSQKHIRGLRRIEIAQLCGFGPTVSFMKLITRAKLVESMSFPSGLQEYQCSVTWRFVGSYK